MRNPYVFVLALFFGLSTFSQKALEEASFKKGNPEFILAEAFTTLSGLQNEGNGTIIVSFLLTKKGEIKNVFPVEFDTEKNGVNAILALQRTSKLWNPATNDGFPIDKKYKIAFNFLSLNSTYETDVKMADKFAAKKMYKQALKYYDRAIKSNKFESVLYLKRAEVKYALDDMKGLRADVLQFKTLQKKFLVNVQLGFVKPNSNKQITYNNKEKED